MFVQSENWKSSNWVLPTSVSPRCDKLLRSNIFLSLCANLLSHCFVTVVPLLCWATTRYATMLSHLYLLSEWRWLVDTHFLPSPCHFQASRTQGAAQSTPGTICCSLRHTTTITCSLQCSKIKSVIARTQIWATVPFVYHCFVEPLHCDTLIWLYHSFTILSQCATMLSPSRFAEPLCWAPRALLNYLR